MKIGGNPMHLIATQGSSTYSISKSLRFNSADSAYLSRTPGSAGNRQKFTISFWMKISALHASDTAQIMFADGNSSNSSYIGLMDTSVGNQIQWTVGDGVSNYGWRRSTLALRDLTAWYHIVMAVDTTLSTAANRMRLYINNVEVTSFSSSGDVPQNTQSGFCNNTIHYIGRHTNTALFGYFDGYLADLYLIDGQQLTPSDFAETSSTTGQWVPKAYTGTYGTTGYHLDFADNSSTTALGYDAAGSNDWSTSNFSVTAGAGNDSLSDTPTNNYCVLNPLVPSAASITNGALDSGTTAVRGTFNAILFNSYWEITAGGSAVTAGVISAGGTTNTTTVTANKTFGFKLTTAGALSYKNITDAGSWTSITTGLTDEQYPYGTTAAANWNFGQRAFAGTADGSSLCTNNLSSDTVKASGTFTGNASADGPFVWCNGTGASLTINGNTVTFGTHTDKLANGFKLRTSSASYNASGSNTWSWTAGTAFRKNNAQTNG
jgi:hypothetical protein